MRWMILPILLCLGACTAVAPQFHGGLTGVDCSLVRMQMGRPFCNTGEPPPERPPFCTRSLGVVDCWANPEALPGPPREVADGPRTLTPTQERLRVGAPP